MRLFVAVVPPAEAIGHLDRAVAPARAACPGLAWIPTERWHLTLAFYGEVADRDVARAERRGVRATRGALPLDLRFAGAGHFGDRVLWAGVQGDRDRLRALAGALATDGRPYRPHLTLARARKRGKRGVANEAGDDLRVVVGLLSAYAGPDWRAAEVVLFRSHLGPKPQHEPIARWPLAALPPDREGSATSPAAILRDHEADAGLGAD